MFFSISVASINKTQTQEEGLFFYKYQHVGNKGQMISLSKSKYNTIIFIIIH